ncbi:MAG: DUF3298 domain-containing protein [Spirochaetaceae bacterium]|nr:DUF3298 domain-containing protein [Spirochaetaceae bacterium]
MKSILFPAIILALILGACSQKESVQPTAEEPKAETPTEPQKQESSQPSLSEYTKTLISDQSQFSEISVEYPVFVGKDKLNEKIKSIADLRLNEFNTGVQLFREDITDDRKHFFQLWTSETIHGNIVSILFSSETYYIGRARGIHGTCGSVVYDSETDSFLTLTQLSGMTPEEIGKFCYDNLPEDAVYKDWLLSATEENISPLPFTLNEDSLSVFFAPDTVAPNAAGEFFLRIPLKN